MDKTVTIFTDGSSTVKKCKQIRFGGIGVHFDNNKFENITVGYVGKNVTNQRMELRACLHGLDAITKQHNSNKFKQITIVTDSMYTKNCIEKWASSWKKNNWTRQSNKKICNLDLIKKLYAKATKMNVKFTHVNSHKKEPFVKTKIDWYLWNGNNISDKLARIAMEKERIKFKI
jgi:ribonuclease HI